MSTSPASSPQRDPVPLRPAERSGPAATPPRPLTSFIGREREIAAVHALLNRADVRLLTLTGPGGVGKTRLVLRVAEDVQGFPDGTWFVALAPVRDPALVASTIAHALGLRHVADQPLEESLAGFLRHQQALLILDNFEHVLEAGPLVANLLSSCPSLTILATSRAVLRISGEHVFAVPPFAVPDAERLPPLDRVRNTDAVQLFVARATASSSNFSLTHGNASAVVEICQRLDGLPLAIELAAARMGAFSLMTLRGRLNERLSLLTDGPGDQPPRLRSMRDAIGWSYDLLDADEQILFARLAVFVGSWTLEAAAAVAGENESGARSSIFDGIASLIGKSLVQQEPDAAGESRYSMLETVREYALEQLTASGEAAAIRERHASYYLALAEQMWAAPTGLEIDVCLRRLQHDLDNLRAALSWLLVHEPAAAVCLAGALDDFWFCYGHFAEGREWLARSLAADTDMPLPVRVRAVSAAGWLAHQQGDVVEAEALLTESVADARTLGDERLLVETLTRLGNVALERGDLEQARQLLDEVRERAPATGMPLLMVLATLSLGRMAAALGDLPRAEALLEEALAGHQRFNGPYAAAFAQTFLADVVLARGDHVRAAALYRDTVVAFAAAGFWAGVADNLELLAGVTVVRQPLPTVRLLGAAELLPHRGGRPRDPEDEPAYERILATARTTLGNADFNAAWDAGQQLSQDEVIAEAMALATAIAAAATDPPGPDTRHGLTRREHEVLCLLAEGRSDREIAAALFISPKTAGVHVSHILAKLGVPSRAAAVAYAVRHRLV